MAPSTSLPHAMTCDHGSRTEVVRWRRASPDRAIVRKLIILDISPGDAPQLLALAVATLSLGGVYWLVRDQDRPERN